MIIGWILIGFLLILDVVATAEIIRDRFSEKTQKIFQGLAVWFIPLLGSILVLYFLRETIKTRPAEHKDTWPGGYDDGVLRQGDATIDSADHAVDGGSANGGGGGSD